jgi:hypothetical protein
VHEVLVRSSITQNDITHRMNRHEAGDRIAVECRDGIEGAVGRRSGRARRPAGAGRP